MFDDRFVTALATEIVARINPQIQSRNGPMPHRLLTVKEAAAYIGRTSRRCNTLFTAGKLQLCAKGVEYIWTERPGPLDREQ